MRFVFMAVLVMLMVGCGSKKAEIVDRMQKVKRDLRTAEHEYNEINRRQDSLIRNSFGQKIDTTALYKELVRKYVDAGVKKTALELEFESLELELKKY